MLATAIGLLAVSRNPEPLMSSTMNKTPPVEGRYRHYKGNYYIVHGEARHSETEEVLILYSPEKSPQDNWVRPKAMFFEDVVVDGKSRARFERID